MKTQINILHGGGVIALSQKISQIKKDFDPLSVTQISGKDFAFDEALVNFSTPGLFSEKRLVVLEDFDLTAGNVDLERFPDDPKLTVVLKASKELTQASILLKQAKKIDAQVFLFKEQDEKLIFPLLDALAEKKKEVYTLFERNYEAYGAQYLLTMIFYMFRRLILKPRSNLAGFVIQKMENQRRNFGMEKIKELYLTALMTDFKIKSGLLDEKIGLTLLIGRIMAI